MVIIKSRNCPYNGNKTNGIISYFRNTTKTDDPYQKGLISIDASSGKDKMTNIFTDSSDDGSGFWYGAGIGSWIEVDFSPNFVDVYGYTLRSFSRDILSSWSITGSNDKSTWNIIDNETGKEETEDVLIDRYYTTDKVIRSKSIRITSLGNRFCSGQSDYFFLHRLELFGFFYSTRKEACTVFNRRSCSPQYFIIIALIYNC